jgi:arabinogalactan endo-1,4-beta-galactosidase
MLEQRSIRTEAMKSLLAAIFALSALAIPVSVEAQTFLRGADLSYANQMEDCGAVFKESGVQKDVYQIFADRGTNLVRVRLWVDPTWQEALPQPDGVKSRYSDIEDVRETIGRARSAGMHVMLDLHYSDFWADPGTQIIPARWREVADNPEALKDSVYQYTVRTLSELDADGLMPDIVKIGNENNGGILVHRDMDAGYNPIDPVSTSWARHAELFNAAISGVRDASATSSITPRIALHFAGLSALSWRYQNLMNHGVTDFDIMGFSYYYSWHAASIAEMGRAVRALRSSFPGYDVMPVETGYLWTTENFDDLPNIINTPDPAYLPVIPEKQLEYMVDYGREVMRAGGAGVIFWEPAWVSTSCRTAWGQGSSHDHVAFFHPSDFEFMENGGGNWTNPAFYEDPRSHKATFLVDMAGQDVSNGVYITGTFAGEPSQILPMADIGGDVYSFFTYLAEGATGSYYFLNGDNESARETVPPECSQSGDSDRFYEMPDGDVVFGYQWGSCAPASLDPVEVVFAVDMTGQDTSRGVYITGDVTGWEIVRMGLEGDAVYSYTTQMLPGSAGAYYHLTTSTWDNYLAYRESVPAACATWYGSDRGYDVPIHPTVYAVRWGTCESFSWPTSTGVPDAPRQTILLSSYPNPFRQSTTVSYTLSTAGEVRIGVYDVLGRHVATLVDERQAPGTHNAEFDAAGRAAGIYIVRVQTPSRTEAGTIVLAD